MKKPNFTISISAFNKFLVFSMIVVAITCLEILYTSMSETYKKQESLEYKQTYPNSIDVVTVNGDTATIYTKNNHATIVIKKYKDSIKN